MIGFPVVEMMAAIGLSNARPMPVVGTRYKYRYSVIGPTDAETLIDPIFLRAALGGADFGLPKRDFVMSLAKPGDESKDRCITEVIEETNG
jgi:CRISPR-associated protein Csx14